jgi:hypothetical protein
MNKLKWNPEIFEREFGRITDKAFEILNHTFGDYYGYNELTTKGVNLVAKYYEIIAYIKSGRDKYTNNVCDLLNDIEQTYYKLLQYRKQKDMEFKINAIEKDF